MSLIAEVGTGQNLVKSGLATTSASALYDTTKGVAALVGSAIGAVLTILGVIFLAMIVYAGFEWLLAAGDEKKVGEALNMLRHSIIGLIITSSAYVITVYVTNAFWSAASVP